MSKYFGFMYVCGVSRYFPIRQSTLANKIKTNSDFQDLTKI